jgi:mannose-1-phosphate guanylyltransferase
VAPFSSPDQIYTVSGRAHLAAIARQLPEIPDCNLLVEPGMRGTGNAIALAAMLIGKQDPDAVMGSFAADHMILDVPAFQRALTAAIESAKSGYLTTIGIEPGYPETGYGYIERTDSLALEGAYFARRFVEKPNLATAEQFLASGRFLWNASMFVWRIDVFLRKLERVQPELFGALRRIVNAWDDPARADEIEREWLDLPVTTIDQGLMEHVDEFVVVPADMGWSDIGDWNGFAELIEADTDENCFKGTVVSERSSRCVVWSDRERPVALVGVRNLAVIDLDDALLIVDREEAQSVRAIVAKMERDRPDLT